MPWSAVIQGGTLALMAMLAIDQWVHRRAAKEAAIDEGMTGKKSLQAQIEDLKADADRCERDREAIDEAVHKVRNELTKQTLILTRLEERVEGLKALLQGHHD